MSKCIEKPSLTLREFKERQNTVSIGIPVNVMNVMDCWVNWMQFGTVTKGYPSKAIGFVSGGINCFDDLGDVVNEYQAKAVDGLYISLPCRHRDCISVIWLGSISNQPDIEIISGGRAAMAFIYRGLRAKGVV
jgi:hypothetical protein